jgi:uncharacterized protein
MKLVLIENQSRHLQQPVRAGYCESFLCQLRGYTFRDQISLHEGLVLVQRRDSRLDASIHMLFVWTDLAVVWINTEMLVVDVCLAKKWHPAYIPSKPARYVLEMAPERLSEFQIGDRLAFV